MGKTWCGSDWSDYKLEVRILTMVADVSQPASISADTLAGIVGRHSRTIVRHIRTMARNMGIGLDHNGKMIRLSSGFELLGWFDADPAWIEALSRARHELDRGHAVELQRLAIKLEELKRLGPGNRPGYSGAGERLGGMAVHTAIDLLLAGENLPGYQELREFFEGNYEAKKKALQRLIRQLKALGADIEETNGLAYENPFALALWAMTQGELDALNEAIEVTGDDDVRCGLVDLLEALSFARAEFINNFTFHDIDMELDAIDANADAEAESFRPPDHDDPGRDPAPDYLAVGPGTDAFDSDVQAWADDHDEAAGMDASTGGVGSAA